MPNKKILLFSDWFAPSYKAGGPIRSCVNFAYAMSDSYQIYILTSNADFGGEILNVTTNKWLDFDANIQVQYLTKEKENIKYLAKTIAFVKPQFIYLNNMYSLFFTLKPLYFILKNNIDVKVILSPRGMLRVSAIKYKPLKKQIFFFIFRLLKVSKKLCFHATDNQEKEDIVKQLDANPDKIEVISNFPQSKQNELKIIPKHNKSLKIVFISRILPIKNLKFVLEQLKRIKNEFKVSLTVVGTIEDDNYWKECLNIIDQLPTNINILYKGEVIHEEIEGILQEHHFFILPTFGENFGHAIFEAFLVGRPVIISNQTPWRNLASQKIGWDISLDNKEQWKKSIEYAISMNQEEFDNWCNAAWRFAQSYINNSSIKEEYLKLFS
jgi:glycosyltransferase involved in cell wall biosynthesis